MGQERALAAIARIERSLARLESAAARPAPPPSPPQADERLTSAHAQLRGKVEAAIAQIDALIETAEAG